MGRIKQSKLNSTRNRTRLRARARSGDGTMFVPRYERGTRFWDGTDSRLRDAARSLVKKIKTESAL